MQKSLLLSRVLLFAIITFFGASLCFAQKRENKADFAKAVVELRKVKTVASTHTGVAGIPSLFGEVSLELLKFGTDEDFLEFLKDKSPVVRSMGLYCLAQKDVKKYADVLKKFLADEEQIKLVITCDVYENAKVGDVAKILLEDPKNMNYY